MGGGRGQSLMLRGDVKLWFCAVVPFSFWRVLSQRHLIDPPAFAPPSNQQAHSTVQPHKRRIGSVHTT